MDDNKNKKQLGYNADIQYEEDYSTEYSYQQTQTDSSLDENGINYDDNFMNNIQEDVDALIQMIPGLPTIMQTAINQVFKPVIKDWNRIKDRKYPINIPDGKKPIIYNPDPPGTIPPGNMPKPPTIDPILKPTEDERPGYIIPEIGKDPIPDLREDPYKTPDGDGTIPFITDDDLFTPSTNRRLIYETIDKKEQYELEYTKNMADLLHFYASRLKGIVSNYYMQLFSGFTSVTSAEDMAFFHNQLTPATSETTKELRHVMDMALRNEVIGANKMNFCINTFTLEGTLYHLKNLRAVQELRLRYADINKHDDVNSPDSMSNKMLNGMADMYNAKYDVAYINLYKHLNGSLRIMDDCTKTLTSGLKARETIIRKGGRK